MEKRIIELAQMASSLVGLMPRDRKPIVRDEPKINRNEPCPCGSNKKYKKCCLLKL